MSETVVEEKPTVAKPDIKRNSSGQFVKGARANPNGRPRRQPPKRELVVADEATLGVPANLPPVAAKLKKLNKRFVDALYRDFQNYGPMAIEQFRQDDPSKYVQLVASFIPKEQTLNVNQRGQFKHEHEHVTTLETSRFLGDLLKQQRSRENAIDVEVEDVVEED